MGAFIILYFRIPDIEDLQLRHTTNIEIVTVAIIIDIMKNEM